jgi:hypothetical protein
LNYESDDEYQQQIKQFQANISNQSTASNNNTNKKEKEIESTNKSNNKSILKKNKNEANNGVYIPELDLTRLHSSESNTVQSKISNNSRYSKNYLNEYNRSNSANIISNATLNTPTNALDESRIVAPNVSKLSPYSAVEIRLESPSGTIAVLCSVDVLKMRSVYFHDVLTEQERNSLLMTSKNNIASNGNENSNVLWRDAICLQENFPFEAAAFLESLHEGRALFHGEWNFVWARLRFIFFILNLN